MLYRWMFLVLIVSLTGCATLGEFGTAGFGSATPTPSAFAAVGNANAAAQDDSGSSSGIRGGALWTLALYIPNRVSDILDIVRLRVRVGMGVGLGARATKPLSGFLGFYSALWGGIPGPRTEPKLNLPVGFEARAGAQASVVDVAATGGVEYGMTEVGFDFHLFVIGLAVGVDPWEGVDFLVGLLTFDPVGDDL